MRAGGGTKHGRYWFGDNLVDTATTPTLSQIQARSTSSSPAIRPRPDTIQAQIEAVKVISVSSVVPVAAPPKLIRLKCANHHRNGNQG